MELKLGIIYRNDERGKLLIVPYGIETFYIFLSAFFHFLLIVPYGIETYHLLFPRDSPFLLIVPYGIETMAMRPHVEAYDAFNCTLWN